MGYAPYYTIMELLHWTLDLTINPKKIKKKIKKNHLYLCTILHNYGTFSLDIGPDDQPKKNQKKNHLYLCTILHNYGTSSLDIGPDDQPKKIKKKSPLSMHHTTQLWNFFIGHWT